VRSLPGLSAPEMTRQTRRSAHTGNFRIPNENEESSGFTTAPGIAKAEAYSFSGCY